MKFELKADKHASVVHLPQRMVMAHTPTYRAAIIDYNNKGHTKLVIDMSQLDYIDSSGLSVLISARKQVMAYQGGIVLLNPSNSVRALIELTRLHQILDIYETEEQALQGLSDHNYIDELAS